MLLVFSVFLFCANASAQNLGTVHGRITDPSGAAVPGATVEIVGKATGARARRVADAGGAYEFADLNPGTYTIQVNQTGFKKLVRENVEVLRGLLDDCRSASRSRFHEPTGYGRGGVRSAAEYLRRHVRKSVQREQVKDLPFLARNVVSLLSLQPGVVSPANPIPTHWRWIDEQDG